MRLPEFILLLAATVAAIAAALAVLASKYSIARVLFWISGLSVWSMGIVWSANSEGYSLQTQLIVAAIVGAVAAAGLTWALWEVRNKEKVEQPTQQKEATTAPVPAPVPVVRGPTLEATRGSKIDATDAIIPGDLPFQFGKADKDSIIDMPGITVTKNENGSYTVSPGKHVNRAFPPPTGEFSSLSNAALNEKIQSVVSELRQFHKNFVRDTSAPSSTPVGPIPEETLRKINQSWERYRTAYEEKYSKLAMSLTSESIARIGSIELTSPSAASGSTTVYYGRFAGHDTANLAAEFLEVVASKLPNK